MTNCSQERTAAVCSQHPAERPHIDCHLGGERTDLLDRGPFQIVRRETARRRFVTDCPAAPRNFVARGAARINASFGNSARDSFEPGSGKPIYSSFPVQRGSSRMPRGAFHSFCE
jgi:hypothetical protein